MNNVLRLLLASTALATMPLVGMAQAAEGQAAASTPAKQWTLGDCIDYALAHNIQISRAALQRQSAHEDVKQAQAALLPSVSAQTSHSVSYTPWITSGISSDGYSRSSIDKTYYNGSYGINANWTVWNGNRNHDNVRLGKLAETRAALDSATQARTVQEQIVQLYVQILYLTEAVGVSRESLATSTKNEERGQEMVRVGKMSRADLAQLTAQKAQDEYNVVAAETQVKNYKRQLKQVLQLTDQDFDVAIPTQSDELALAPVPTVASVYDAAQSERPEVRALLNSIDQSQLNIKMAKAQRLPTVSMNAGVNTSTTSMNNMGWGRQMRNNVNVGAGVTVSVPIYDNRTTRTAVNKAQISLLSSRLELLNERTTLYSTIENYWLQAQNNQDQFRAAQKTTASAQQSYDLLSEQFRLGLKNIVELMTGKDRLLQAKQSELQAKYLTILNLDLLNFYRTGTLR